MDGPSDAFIDAPSADATSAGGPITLAVPCDDPNDAVYVPPSGLPPYDATHRGDMVRCASDGTLAIPQIGARLAAINFSDVDVRSSIRVHRIAYRTDRLLGQEGLATALVLLPDQPIAPDSPLVVAAHGISGIAHACAPSKQNLMTAGDTEIGMYLVLASYGYAVVAPDYAGFAGDATPGFLLAEDEAHALLDSTRAMQRILAPGGIGDQVVMVGHSQGGHAVLAAQALSGQYGLAGNLVAVVPFAPFWMVGRTWGAIVGANLSTASGSLIVWYATLYFYSHAEIDDGPGRGVGVFQASKQDQVRQMVTTSCSSQNIGMLGNTIGDFIDPTFAQSVGPCGLLGNCSTPLGAVWLARFRADRPALNPTGAEILLWQGGMDRTITPGYAKCGFDKMTADLSAPGATTTLTICGDVMADHGGIVLRDMSWAARWIAWRTVGAPAPTPCPPVSVLSPDGGVLNCPNPPGNGD